MEIFPIKKEIQNIKIIEEYFFEFIETKEFECKKLYFKQFIDPEDNIILDFKFNISFLILNKLFKSMTSTSGDYLFDNIYLKAEIW